jgi:hypothetical protein
VPRQGTDAAWSGRRWPAGKGRGRRRRRGFWGLFHLYAFRARGWWWAGVFVRRGMARPNRPGRVGGQEEAAPDNCQKPTPPRNNYCDAKHRRRALLLADRWAQLLCLFLLATPAGLGARWGERPAGMVVEAVVLGFGVFGGGGWLHGKRLWRGGRERWRPGSGDGSAGGGGEAGRTAGGGEWADGTVARTSCRWPAVGLLRLFLWRPSQK